MYIHCYHLQKCGLINMYHIFVCRTSAQNPWDRGKTSRDQNFEFSRVRNFPIWPMGLNLALPDVMKKPFILIIHLCNEKTLRLSKDPEVTLCGTEKTLRDPEICTEGTDKPWGEHWGYHLTSNKQVSLTV